MKTKQKETGVRIKLNTNPLINGKVRKKSTDNRCKGCGCLIAIGNTFCGECMCEDDCGY